MEVFIHLTKPDKKDALSGNETALLLSTLGGGGAAEQPAAGQNANPLNTVLLKLLERKLMKEMKQEEEAEEQLRKLKAAQLEAVKRQTEQKKWEQSMCNHMKRNGEPRISGQKLTNGKYHLLCLMCQKEFDGNTLPPHLHPNMDMIGG